MYSLYLNRSINDTPTSLQAVYASHEDADISTGLRELVESYNRRLPPSRLLFVCPSGIEGCIQESLTSKDAEGRLASTTHVAVAPYNSDGRVLQDHVLHIKDAGDWAVSDSFIYRLAKSAVAKIVDDTKTILDAPHGYRFLKPSGREEDIFVRAGNMLRELGSLSVFNYLLLRKLPANCRVVYIDSFTILSFALGLKSLIRYFHNYQPSLVVPVIENIHSYEISPDFRIPNELNYFIVISASTSGGLARKLVKEKQALPERIVHLLGVGRKGDNLRDKCIYFRVRKPSNRVTCAGEQNAIIEIGTEEFLVAQGSPRPVRITQSHVNSQGASELHKTFYLDALKFYEPRPSAGTGYSTFSLSNEPASYSSSPIPAWIGKTLSHELPASVRMLVHLDDPMSAQVAGSIQQSLGRDITKRSLAELQKSPPDSSGGATVVVAYQDPDLEGVGRTNIALRSSIDAHRHYLVCYAFPSSDGEHKRLKDDLRMGPGGMRSGWSEFLVLPVGASALHESFALESSAFKKDAVASRRSALGGKLAEVLGTRNGRSEIPSDGLFLPRIDGTPLRLRPGSVFFSEQKEGVAVSQVSVYAMVAAAMQKAREMGSGSGGGGRSGFDDNPFVRSVLDPSMFARFNDGILQASLLRAAQLCELDYSASENFSRQFASTCLSVFVNCNQDVGDAALEFVHALVTEKVALRPADHDRLVKKMKSNAVLSSVSDLLKAEED